MMNKKADVQSMIIMLIILFLVAVVGVVFTMAFKEIQVELEASEKFNKSSNALTALDTAVDGTKHLDYLFFFLFIGFTLGLIVSSLFIKAHPAFMVLFILGWIITIVLAALFANAYTELTAQSELQEVAATFVFTSNLIAIFPLLMFVVGLITLVVIYGKARSPMETGV